MGIPSGKKSATNPHFPSFIFESESTIRAALRGFLSDEGYVAGNSVYVDISVRIPKHELNAVKLLPTGRKYRSNLLEDVSKMLMKLSISHQLYPQRMMRNKGYVSLIWRIKIRKDELLRNGISWGS